MIKRRRFEGLVESFHAPLFRYAYWLTKDKEVSEDLVQETFLRAWRSLDSLKEEKAAKSWLITILRRENARRFERKRFDMSDTEVDTVADELPPVFDTERMSLQKAITELPPAFREPLIMQVALGYSTDEIATEMGLPANTVSTRLFRARQQLKKILDVGQDQPKAKRHPGGEA